MLYSWTSDEGELTSLLGSRKKLQWFLVVLKLWWSRLYHEIMVWPQPTSLTSTFFLFFTHIGLHSVSWTLRVLFLHCVQVYFWLYPGTPFFYLFCFDSHFLSDLKHNFVREAFLMPLPCVWFLCYKLLRAKFLPSVAMDYSVSVSSTDCKLHERREGVYFCLTFIPSFLGLTYIW